MRPLPPWFLGVDTHVLKVKIFVLSAVLGSLAGSLFAHYVSFVSVDSFSVDRAITFLLLAVLGGARTITGTVLGAAFRHGDAAHAQRFGDFHAVLFAACLITAVIYLPEGFGGALQAAFASSAAALGAELRNDCPARGSQRHA
jgi:branched-chain amino acid transport system permease protein